MYLWRVIEEQNLDFLTTVVFSAWRAYHIYGAQRTIGATNIIRESWEATLGEAFISLLSTFMCQHDIIHKLFGSNLTMLSFSYSSADSNKWRCLITILSSCDVRHRPMQYTPYQPFLHLLQQTTSRPPDNFFCSSTKQNISHNWSTLLLLLLVTGKKRGWRVCVVCTVLCNSEHNNSISWASFTYYTTGVALMRSIIHHVCHNWCWS